MPEGPAFVETSLLDVPFGTWSGFSHDSELIDPWTPTWNENEDESFDLLYGDDSLNGYADLSDYDLLVVFVTNGEPRFLLNRDVDEGQWNATEAESHLIDNTKDGWSAKYFSHDDQHFAYTVDLDLLVKEKGFAHLHAIKGANWVPCCATKMVVLKKVEE